MTLTAKELENISDLAYLDLKTTQDRLAADINEIMAFVDTLRAIDTKQVEPLYHPFNLDQRLRSDGVTEVNCREHLMQIAPLTEEGLYLVPKVIESGK